MVKFKSIVSPMMLAMGLTTAAMGDNASIYDFTNAKAIMDGYVAEDKIAGAVVMVMKDGKPVLHYAAGMADKEAGRAMEKDSLFRIASQTKAFTTIAAMILYERGQLGLHNPVSKYIPAFKSTTVATADGGVEPATREITIHDLLTHTAGISYGWNARQTDWEAAGVFGWYFADEDKSVGEVLKALPTLPQDAQPGTSFVYGHNTDLIGVIIEKVTGKTLKAVFDDEIIKPLQLKDTQFYVGADKVSRLAAVYSATDGTIERAATPGHMTGQGHYVSGPHKAYSGGAGLVSTAADYSKLLSLLLHKGSLGDVTLLSPETVDMMTENQIGEIQFGVPGVDLGKSLTFGYGFTIKADVDDIDGDGNTAETAEYGWGGAYHSMYFVQPITGVTAVYLTQLIPANGLKDWDEVKASIFKSLK